MANTNNALVNVALRAKYGSVPELVMRTLAKKGYSSKEAAEHLGVTLVTIHWHLGEAMRLLLQSGKVSVEDVVKLIDGEDNHE